MINSLGIKKSPKDTKIVVAMSGGVDSSVVARSDEERGIQCYWNNTEVIR